MYNVVIKCFIRNSSEALEACNDAVKALSAELHDEVRVLPVAENVALNRQQNVLFVARSLSKISFDDLQARFDYAENDRRHHYNAISTPISAMGMSLAKSSEVLADMAGREADEIVTVFGTQMRVGDATLETIAKARKRYIELKSEVAKTYKPAMTRVEATKCSPVHTYIYTTGSWNDPDNGYALVKGEPRLYNGYDADFLEKERIDRANALVQSLMSDVDTTLRDELIAQVAFARGVKTLEPQSSPATERLLRALTDERQVERIEAEIAKARDLYHFDVDFNDTLQYVEKSHNTEYRDELYFHAEDRVRPMYFATRLLNLMRAFNQIKFYIQNEMFDERDLYDREHADMLAFFADIDEVCGTHHAEQFIADEHSDDTVAVQITLSPAPATTPAPKAYLIKR